MDESFSIPTQSALKRILDILLCISGLLLLWPVYGLIALAIKLDSKGPVLFRHRRIGKDGIPFNLYKFRSMYEGKNDTGYMQYLSLLIDSERDGSSSPLPYKKLISDTRVTRVGAFLRRFFLDELPQIFNILKGDMSLVGPRPHVQFEVEHYTVEQRRRLAVKPGATGLWQVLGKENYSFSELIGLDLDYIDNWSTWLDLKIIILTAFLILRGGEGVTIANPKKPEHPEQKVPGSITADSPAIAYSTEVDRPVISVIIPVHNAASTLAQCLKMIYNSPYDQFECILVDDSSTDHSLELARQYPIKFIDLPGGPYGPAFARNQGAKVAKGEILLFIDSDVYIHQDTLEKVALVFKEQPDVDAVFGSYDETPYDQAFLSQYRNLLHHFIHQQAHEKASTFWSGCGAVRAAVFSKMGGFNAERFPRPSIEDIELGARMAAAGHQILLSKSIQVTHLKHWSFVGMLKTDLLNRAIPWALLIFQNKSLPNDLNLRFSQRLSSLLLIGLSFYLSWSSLRDNIFLLPAVTGLFFLLVISWYPEGEVLIFKSSPKTERFSFFLIAAISMMALFDNTPLLLAPFVLLIPIMLVGSSVSMGKKWVSQSFFTGMMLMITAEFILLLASYPRHFIVPVLALVIVIVLLNFPLYMFFLRKRGLTFTAAVLPLQLLYYLYSTVGFVIGGGIHFWNKNIRRPRFELGR